MITVSSLKHSAKSEDSYAYDNETLHVRLRTLRGEVDKVIDDKNKSMKFVVVKPYVNFKNIDDVTIVEPRNIG